MCSTSMVVWVQTIVMKNILKNTSMLNIYRLVIITTQYSIATIYSINLVFSIICDLEMI
jgi:hypothetical protein